MTHAFLKMLRHELVRYWIASVILTAFVPIAVSADSTLQLTYDPSSLTITSPNGQAHQPPILVGDQVAEQIDVALNTSGTDSTGNECTVDNLSWSVSGANDAISTDGGSTFHGTDGNEGFGVPDASPPFELVFEPDQAGYWKVYVQIKAHFHSNCGDQSNGGWQDKYGNASLYFAVKAPDFSFSLSPSSLTINTGDSAVATAELTPLNGFAGGIGFSSAPGDVSGINVSGNGYLPGGEGGGTLSVSVSNNVPPSGPAGYPLYVRGTATSPSFLSHDVSLTVIVPLRYVEIDGPYDSGNQSKSGPNFRDSNGALTVDVAIGRDPGNTFYTNGSNFTAKTAAPDGTNAYTFNPQYEWTSTGDMTQGTDTAGNFGSYGSASSVYSHLSSSSAGGGAAFGVTSTIAVSVKNTANNSPMVSGTTSSNTYTIRWHYPTENYMPYGTPISTSMEYPASEIDPGDSNTAIAGGVIHCEFPPIGDYYIGNVSGGVASGFSLASNFVGFPYNALFAALGLAAGTTNLGPQTYTDDTDSLQAWQEAVALTQAGDPEVPPQFVNAFNQSAAWQQCQMADPFISMHFVDRYYQGDAYGSNGYTGPDKKAFRKSTSEIATGTFTKL